MEFLFLEIVNLTSHGNLIRDLLISVLNSIFNEAAKLSLSVPCLFSVDVVRVLISVCLRSSIIRISVVDNGSGVSVSTIVISTGSVGIGNDISRVGICGVSLIRVDDGGVSIGGVVLSRVVDSGVGISGVDVSGVSIDDDSVSGVRISGAIVNGVNNSSVSISGISTGGVGTSSVVDSGVGVGGVGGSGINHSAAVVAGGIGLVLAAAVLLAPVSEVEGRDGEVDGGDSEVLEVGDFEVELGVFAVEVGDGDVKSENGDVISWNGEVGSSEVHFIDLFSHVTDGRVNRLLDVSNLVIKFLGKVCQLLEGVDLVEVEVEGELILSK